MLLVVYYNNRLTQTHTSFLLYLCFSGHMNRTVTYISILVDFVAIRGATPAITAPLSDSVMSKYSPGCSFSCVDEQDGTYFFCFY